MELFDKKVMIVLEKKREREKWEIEGSASYAHYSR